MPERTIDEGSFQETAAQIWRLNDAVRKKYPSATDFEKWMIEETRNHGASTQEWGTYGFTVSLWENCAKAAVEGWFIAKYAQPVS